MQDLGANCNDLWLILADTNVSPAHYDSPEHERWRVQTGVHEHIVQPGVHEHRVQAGVYEHGIQTGVHEHRVQAGVREHGVQAGAHKRRF